MVSWEQLVDGWTHGIPGGTFGGFETRTSEDGWVQVKLPRETIRALVMTPDFVTWQGAVWMFDGATPMAFVGEWKRKDFEARTPNGMPPEAFFRSIIRDCDDRLWEYADGVCIYVFRNPETGRYAANYDMD
jgi:hypothetical protein